MGMDLSTHDNLAAMAVPGENPGIGSGRPSSSSSSSVTYRCASLAIRPSPCRCLEPIARAKALVGVAGTLVGG